MKNLYLTLALTLILLSNTSLKAACEFYPICTNHGNTQFPSSQTSSVSGKIDGTLICWLEESNSGSLWMQKLNTEGTALWELDGKIIDQNLGSGFTVESDYPVIFSDNVGGAVIIYRRILPGSEDIYMRHVLFNGLPSGPPVAVSTPESGYNTSPSAVLTMDGKIAIAWENFIRGDFDIHAQLLGFNGEKLWNEGREVIVCKNTFDQRKPQISCSRDNTILIAWLDARNRTEYAFDLYANTIDIHGNIQVESRNGRRIYHNLGAANVRKEIFYNHNIISVDMNSFIIALEDSYSNQYSNVSVIKINDNLEDVWSLDLKSGAFQRNPLIVKNGRDEASVIWNESSDHQSEIKGILLNSSGKALWGESTGSLITCGKIRGNDIKTLPDINNKNGFLLNNDQLFVSWVNLNSRTLFLNNINLTDGSSQCENSLRIQDFVSEGEYTSITNQRNKIVIVFKQSGNIFAAIRNKSETDFTNSIMESKLDNFPNPFNPSTKISFSIPSDGFVRLSVFDITGRQINTLVNEYKSAGEYSARFDGSNLSSGIYIYRLETNGNVYTRKMTMIK